MKKYETAWVLGLGSSGEAAARLLLAEGTAVQILDQDETELLKQRADGLKALGAIVRLGQSELPPDNVSVCIVSPGVPSDSSWVKDVEARGIPVISELELGWSRAQSRVLAITGSNGKSTLVKLCAQSMEKAGLNVAIAGNYEAESSYPVPVSHVVAYRKALDWLVLEVSSFQLETVKSFRPDVGVLLNIFSNHLDRHKNFAIYQQIKSRLFSRMSAKDIGIVHENVMPEIVSLAGSKNQWISFGLSADAAFRFHEDAVHCRTDGCSVSLGGTIFENEALGLTGAAAVAVMSVCGVPLNHVETTARNFQPLPHRMQDIGTRDGVRFIDDSKATNLAAMIAALNTVGKPIRLVAGGLPKHESYESARSLLAENVVGVNLIGKAADIMASAWQDVVPCVMSPDLEHAVLTAWEQSAPGETILLSPACASFDQFHDFEERGDRFIECVKLLKGKKKMFDKKPEIG